MSFDMNKMLKQVQQMQAQMAEAQQELANERVQASAGGGMVTVTASGAGEIVEIKIAPEAIDPDDPELLADMILAAVNEALRSAQSLAETKLGGAAGLGDLGSLGLPGL
jgi:nucleoid-associated protein EbfC